MNKEKTEDVVHINSKKIFSLLFILNVFFMVVHLVLQTIRFSQDIDTKIIDLFNVNMELSIPTWYSGILLFACALTSYVISKIDLNIRNKPFWRFIAFTFVFLSIDELAEVHEKIGHYLGYVIETSGIFHFKWVLVYVPILIILGLVFIKFFRRVDRKLFRYMFLSAVVFIAGAVGFEMISAGWADIHGQENMVFMAVSAIEEFFEMLGASIFIYATLDYIKRVKISKNLEILIS
jgi:hypothetical protein